MRNKEVKSISSEKERALLEKCLKDYKSLYDMSLECGISETSLWKYRNGYEQGLKIKNKITSFLNKGCFV